MTHLTTIEFDVQNFLRTAGAGRRIISLKPKEVFFSQGSVAGSVFYLHSGRAKITTLSNEGKEATLTLLSPGDFFGQGSVASVSSVHTATASAITECRALNIDSSEVLRVMRNETTFSSLFADCLLAHNMRIQADFVDQLFNSSEKRLARILLLMAYFGESSDQPALIQPITQENLADMIGTTRSRVNFFMNGFRKKGFIDYNCRIIVRRSLESVLMQDRPEEQDNAIAPFLRAG